MYGVTEFLRFVHENVPKVSGIFFHRNVQRKVLELDDRRGVGIRIPAKNCLLYMATPALGFTQPPIQ
jgi:hypothetical protein